LTTCRELFKQSFQILGPRQCVAPVFRNSPQPTMNPGQTTRHDAGGVGVTAEVDSDAISDLYTHVPEVELNRAIKQLPAIAK
jgi:hypothetical protein